MMFAVRLVAVICGLGLSAAACAQDYPAKGVRVLVGAAPGGPVDIAARVLAEKLAAAWGQPVTVENRVGASEMIATGLVSQAPPDGHTLLMASLNVVTINPVVFSKIAYDPDVLAPIVLTTRNPMVLIAGPNAPFNSVAELVKIAKARRDGVQWSTPGLATANHIAGEWFAAETGARLFHVPYKGGPAAANAVLSGDVPFGVVSLIQALPLAKAGQVKALAVTTGKRSVLAPDWPTIAESAVPGFDVAVQTAFFAPGGIPPAVVAKINAEVNRLLQLPEVRERYAAMGVEAAGSTPEELHAMVKTVRARIQQIVQRAGIKVQ